MPLAVGDPIPDFVRIDQHGQTIDTAAIRQTDAGRWLVVFFYPKDNTPVCTGQACSLRNAAADLRLAGLGATVIGVSNDSDESHRGFSKKHTLEYSIICDADGSLRRMFGVKRWLGLMDGRATFVIDPAGVIRGVCTRFWSAKAHGNLAREIILAGAKPAPAAQPR